MSNLIADFPQLKHAFEQLTGQVRHVQHAKRNGLNIPGHLRGTILYSDITSANVQAQPIAQWYSFGGVDILDSLVEDELKAVEFGPTTPGGRELNPLPVWGTNILRKTGTAAPGAEPTLQNTPCVPIDMHGYMTIDEGALRAMMYRFQRSTFFADQKTAIWAENDLFIKSFLYACLRALLRLSWQGDTGGAAGLNMIDGWLKQLDDSGSPGKIMTAGVDYIGTIFPALEDAMPDERHLDQPDVVIATTRGVRRAYMRQVQQNKNDERGGYDPVTKTVYFNNAPVVGFTDICAGGANARAVLTRKANLVLDIVDEPLSVDTDMQLVSRSHEFSSPFQAQAKIADLSAAAMWTAP